MTEIEYVGDVAMWRGKVTRSPRDSGAEHFMLEILDNPRELPARADELINRIIPVAHRPPMPRIKVPNTRRSHLMCSRRAL